MIKNFLIKHEQLLKFFLIIHNRIIGKNRYKLNGNTLHGSLYFLKKTNIEIFGSDNNIEISDNCILRNCNIKIFGNNNTIKIGSKCKMNETEFWIENDKNEIIIGKNTTVHGKTQIAAIESTKVTIGEDCMLSNNIQFRTGDSHSVIDSAGKRVNKSKNIHVGNHVWIGQNNIILKGVEIPDNCIVGAGSVVGKGFNEQNSIIVGNPAKIVKSNINWLRQRIKIQ